MSYEVYRAGEERGFDEEDVALAAAELGVDFGEEPWCIPVSKPENKPVTKTHALQRRLGWAPDIWAGGIKLTTLCGKPTPEPTSNASPTCESCRWTLKQMKAGGRPWLIAADDGIIDVKKSGQYERP
ncbi:MAG: hypothetical protein WA182_13855 [Candidatus Sulfotelmatobacter sp.]